jgi:hypothetical protein
MTLILALALVAQQPSRSDFDLFQTPQPTTPTVEPEKPSPRPHREPTTRRSESIKVSISVSTPKTPEPLLAPLMEALNPVRTVLAPPYPPQWYTVNYKGRIRTVLGFANPNGNVDMITDSNGDPLYEATAPAAPTLQYVLAPAPTVQYLALPATTYVLAPSATMYYVLPRHRRLR